LLGENFLGHFKLFIDNAHKLVCLDQTGAMRDPFLFTKPYLPLAAIPLVTGRALRG
jgi:hypothetical protein